MNIRSQPCLCDRIIFWATHSFSLFWFRTFLQLTLIQLPFLVPPYVTTSRGSLYPYSALSATSMSMFCWTRSHLHRRHASALLLHLCRFISARSRSLSWHVNPVVDPVNMTAFHSLFSSQGYTLSLFSGMGMISIRTRTGLFLSVSSTSHATSLHEFYEISRISTISLHFLRICSNFDKC